MVSALRIGVWTTIATALAASLAAQVPGSPPAQPGLRIVVLEGEGAINNIREQRAKEPVVRVTDAEFRPVAGASVTFLTTELGASATFPSGHTFTTTCDLKGEATGRGLRPNNVAGPFEIRVTATRGGQTATAVIHQTNAAPVAVRKGSSKKGLVALIIGGGAAAGVTLAVTSRKYTAAPSTPAQPASSATTITAGTGSFGKP